MRSPCVLRLRGAIVLLLAMVGLVCTVVGGTVWADDRAFLAEELDDGRSDSEVRAEGEMGHLIQDLTERVKGSMEGDGGSDGSDGGGRGTYGLAAILLLTVLSVAPAILVLTTSFTRIIVVLHFLRQAVGVQGVPPDQILMGLALLLTVFSMGGVVEEVRCRAVMPLLEGQLEPLDAALAAQEPLRVHMLRHTREADLMLLLESSPHDLPEAVEEIPLSVLVPAYALGELRVAFIIGLVILLPFFVLDVVVSVVLVSSGLSSLSPTTVALPFKLVLFVLIDGWTLIVGSLVRSIMV